MAVETVPVPNANMIENQSWHCHCCTAKNDSTVSKCRICGRPESYAQEGYPLPLHGRGALLFRPSQIINVLSDINGVDSVHWTPLHSACANGNVGMALELLRLRSVVDAKTDKGQTALHLAIYSGSFEIVEALVKAGACVNATTDFEKCSPLHLACSGGRKKIVAYLLDNNAVVNAKNIIERTPLHLSAAIGHGEITAILLKAGADHKAMDIHGWTARQTAELNGHRTVQELLVRIGMPEKQPVLKELPTAPWHCDLWDELIVTQKQRQDEEEREKLKWINTKLEADIARRREQDRRQQEKLALKTQERQRNGDGVSDLATTLSRTSTESPYNRSWKSSASAENTLTEGAVVAAAGTGQGCALDQPGGAAGNKYDIVELLRRKRAAAASGRGGAGTGGSALYPKYANNKPPPLSLLGMVEFNMNHHINFNSNKSNTHLNPVAKRGSSFPKRRSASLPIIDTGTSSLAVVCEGQGEGGGEGTGSQDMLIRAAELLIETDLSPSSRNQTQSTQSEQVRPLHSQLYHDELSVLTGDV